MNRIIAFFLLLFPAAIFMADEKPSNDKEALTLSVDVKVVNMLATVRDKSGQIIRDLSKDDFNLQVDGKTWPIGYFAKETDLPLTIGLVVDTSPSQTNVLDEERNASYRFLSGIMREQKDLAFVMHFGDDVELLQDFTGSTQKLAQAIEDLRADTSMGQRPGNHQMPSGSPPRGSGTPQGGPGGGGSSKVYDALFLASDEMMKKQTGRKAIIILSDGVDVGSKTRLEKVIESAQRTDSIVYSIYFVDKSFYNHGTGTIGLPPMGGGRGGPMGGGGGMPSGGPGGSGGPADMHNDGKKILQRISKETGGAFFEVTKKEPIDKIYEQIGQELRYQYNLGFSINNAAAGPGYHKITLTTTKKNATVQTRDGYYANR